MTKAVLYLTENKLLVQTEKKVLGVLDLSDFIEKGKVKDEAAFTLFLKEKFDILAKKVDQGIIVLGLGLLQQKAFEKDDDVEDGKKEFLKEVDIPEENIQQKVIETPAKTYLLVTDKTYYGIFYHVARDAGIEIPAVLPLSLFSDGEQSELNKDEVKTILEKEQLYEAGNFLDEKDFVSPPSDDAPKKEKIDFSEPVEEVASKDETSDTKLPPYETVTIWNKSRLLLILGFLVVLTVLMGALIYMQQTHQGLTLLSKPTPTPTEAPTPTPTPQEVSKADLTVEVQNGTGTPGQAAKAKGLMEGLEYTKVTTANADSTTHDTTEVVFSSKVSESQQKEIKSLLLKSFKVVTTKVDPSAATDIVITTGTEK